MEHDYIVNELLLLHELQPSPLFYPYPYDLKSNGNAAPGYDLTAALEGDAYFDAHSLVAAHQTLHVNHNTKKRKNHFSDAGYEMQKCDLSLPRATASVQEPIYAPKKRKASIVYSDVKYEMQKCDVSLPRATASVQEPSYVPKKRKTSNVYAASSTCDDDGSEDARSTRTAPDKKQNHSEIEKRRRDKMNTYISELSAIVPMCGAMARKLDKLTVLRMAVQHLRSIRGALSAGPLTPQPRPAFLSERELNALVLHAAKDCFLMVVGCDRGRLMYVSTSVTSMLHYDQSELLGQSFFDILHPKDVAKVKEQLSSSDLSPRERLIDAKTMLPVKADVVAGASRLCPGARRTFFCRIKCRVNSQGKQSESQVKEENEPNGKMRKKHVHEKKYCVVQCTGYLKSWAPAEMTETGNGAADSGPEDNEASNMTCLVAVVRALADLAPQAPPEINSRHLQYISRHAPDGKFLFVDQRVTLVLGFLPQELLGTSLYEYVNPPELGAVAQTHKTSLLQRNELRTPPYFFRRKDGTYARIQTHFKPFRNPWTKDVECIVANNSVVTDDQVQPSLQDCQHYDVYKQKADIEMERLIESHKIGSTIAEEALRRSSTDFSPDLSVDLLQDAVFNQQPSLVDNILGVDMSNYSNQVRNNVPLSSAGAESSPPLEANGLTSTSPPLASPPLPSLGLDGNGEAAMAVIMSLLEADAGLGGPVNFSGLPWPLP